MADGAAAGPRDRDLLRFLTCGSVDDGKSTLIGRLLYDCALIPEDRLAALERESRRFGTTGEDLDFSLLLDGLEEERQQKITIDVAYRFFATPRRAFIVADAPGHEQFTRNMATGASTADLAVILVDARKGILKQTRRHAFIASLLGIRHLVLAVNKMDLIGFDARAFEEIATLFSAFAAGLGDLVIRAIPLSARARRACRGIGGQACSSISRRSRSPPAPSGRSAFRCNGSTAPMRNFAAFPARSSPAPSGRAIGCSSSARAAPRGSRRSSLSTAI